MPTPIQRIDTTPLVGVALILVIVFMVTSPLMMKSADMDLELPKARTVEAKSRDNITISVAKDGQLALNEELIGGADLQAKLSAEIAEDPDRLVVIQADKHVTHDQILTILGRVKKAGATHLAIATIQRKRENT